MNYNIIKDETKLDNFLTVLAETTEEEVYYLCLFNRYGDGNDSILSRVTARNKAEVKEKIRRMEAPLGAYTRDGLVVRQEDIALYMGLNPRSLVKANKGLLIEMAKRFANGDLNFHPISLATTEIHRATDRKFFVDFDYDHVDPDEAVIKQIIPEGSYRILKTRGGYHLLVELAKVNKKDNWFKQLAGLPSCDVHGTNTLTPVPGCTQGGFTPYFLEG